ncbi:MAG: universal stress protein [Balneolales bacterium]
MDKPRILVPTDLSELSLAAFSSADYLADILNGTVIPLHVYQPEKESGSFPVSPEPPQSVREIEKELEAKALELVAEQRLEPVIILKGKAWKIIMKESEKMDLVVMSSHGRTGFSRLFLGSVTERVVRFSKSPVLLVKKESSIKPLNNILLTTDFSDHSLLAFDYATSLVQKTDARIHLVHLISLEQFKSTTAFENQFEIIREKLNNWVDKHLSNIRSRVTAEVLPVSSSVHEAIVHLTSKNRYNLVVMSTLGHTGLTYLRLGSTAANVLRLVKTAVLSVNPRMNADIGNEHVEF